MYAEAARESSLSTPPLHWHVVPPQPAVREAAPLQPAARCSTCSLRAVCMPPDLTSTELQQLDTVVLTTRNVHRG
ncbi:MAG TPA: Crp/Fnr family transcriptional regulator, partial [Paraburkholderia sp.]|nr:Crp/Fnr family transcriptional regulator [Paraburkholderia sp.]